MMDSLKVLKGKAAGSSSTSFSFKYNADGEEVEQLFDSLTDKQVTDVQDEDRHSSPDAQGDKRVSPFLSKLNRRTLSLEETQSGETWRFFTDIKGRITKTVEEKLGEIKSERVKPLKKLKKELPIQSNLGHNSSISDSEERSETSSSVKESSSPEKSISEKIDQEDKGSEEENDLTDETGDERATTPQITEVDLSDSAPGRDPSTAATKRIHFWHRSRNQSNSDHKSARRRRRKTRSSIEVGVEATESDFCTNEEELDPDHLETKIPRCLKILWDWWPLIFPVIAAIMFNSIVLPSSVTSFIGGILVAVEGHFILSVLHAIYLKDNSDNNVSDEATAKTVPMLNEAPTIKPDKPEQVLHEGWINHFPHEYSPLQYHISRTSTVYVRLEGSLLRLATPKQRIPKRAFWTETDYKLEFLEEKMFNISNCAVSLLPEGLARKRLWSKKYPICINLLPNSYIGTRQKEKDKAFLEEYEPPPSPTSLKSDSQLSSSEGKDSPQHSRAKKDSTNGDDDGGHLVKSDSLDDPFLDAYNDESTAFQADEEDEGEDGFIQDYEEIKLDTSHLYLFARSDREKEIWFRRFVAASGYPCKGKKNLLCPTPEEVECEILAKKLCDRAKREMTESAYLEFMKSVGQVKTSLDDPQLMKPGAKKELATGNVWVNALLSRILYDFFRDTYWKGRIQDKIQKKLSTIKIPNYMEELVVSSLEIGDSVPTIENSTNPVLNEHGLWFELKINYGGSFKMTVDTKLNLMKLKKVYESPVKALDVSPEGKESPLPQGKSAIFDSSLEDSAESSDEETEVANNSQTPPITATAGPKVLKMVDKIAASKYFHQVTENKYVKGALLKVSNTNISLIVEVKSLKGTLVLNIPPPPSDRLWYGFRAKPKLRLSAQPKWGERAISLLNITGWIERNLIREFQKLVVLPNMDDIVIPIMSREEFT